MKRTVLLTLLLMLGLTTGCGMVVDSGNRGVEIVWGKVQSQPLTEGFYFYNPFSTDIVELSVKEQKWEDSTECFSNDAQAVNVSFALNYLPNSAKIHELYRDKGADYEKVLIPQVVMQHLKEVIGQYKAMELIPNREKVRNLVRTAITSELVMKEIIVRDFAINNIDFTKEFQHAVEAKVVAQQRAQEEQNKTVQIKEQASQKLIQAQAEAQAIKIKSDALAKNPELVRYNAVEKWDGKLPEVMLSGNSTPFININDLLKK